jgi:predicted phage replisome organizer
MSVSWLALDVGILSDEKIKLIRKLPEGDGLFVLWIGILCLAMKAENKGMVELSPGIPYDPEDLADVLGLPLNTVKLGVSVFEKKFNMIKIINGTIEVVNFFEHQHLEKLELYMSNQREKTRLRVEKYRNKLKLLPPSKEEEKGNSSVTETLCNAPTITITNTITRTKEKEKKDVYGEFGNVKLTPSEHQKLILKIGPEKTSLAIEKLSSYLASKGDKYKSHYATMFSWVIESVNGKTAPNKSQAAVDEMDRIREGKP